MALHINMLYTTTGILGLIVLLALWLTRRPRRAGKQLKGPAGLPMYVILHTSSSNHQSNSMFISTHSLGNAFDLTPPQILPQLAKYSEEYGSTYELNVLGTRLVITSELDVIQDVLSKRPKTFRRPMSLEGVSRVLGHGCQSFCANSPREAHAHTPLLCDRA